MPRLPYADLSVADDETLRFIATLPRPSSIVRMLANATSLLAPVNTLILTIVKQLELKPRHRELVVLNVAGLENGRYEWEQHKAVGQAAGVTEQQIEAIRTRAIDECHFDPAELCILRFSEELVEKAVAAPSSLAAMQEHFNAREIVETMLVVGTYMMLVRLTETTDIDIEPALQGAALANLMKAG